MTTISNRVEGRRAERSGAHFEELLDSFRSGLESELRRFLDEKIRRAPAPREAGELLEPLKEFVLRGGKRLRPALVEFAFRAADGGSGVALPVALSIEFLHTYLLVHDDIMDGAHTRRGGPAAHRVFEADHRGRGWRGDSRRHGESTAVLMGDLAHSFAVELFMSAPIAEAVRPRAARVFSEMCEEVVVGQYLEMTAPHRDGLQRADLLTILRLKSGRYSVERPLQLGAILAGASDHMRAGLSEFGLAVGEAFQLQDDLLGVFGDTKAVGKPVGGDLAEGKFTLLILVALERSGPGERQEILDCLHDEGADAERILSVTRLIESLGARREIESMVSERLSAARIGLEALEVGSEGHVFFSGLIDYLAGRRA